MTEISKSGASLLEEFAKETEYKSSSNTINTDDFDTEIVNDEFDDFEPEVNSNDNIQDEPIYQPETNLLSVETSASLYVGVFDSLQQTLLTTIHNWKLKKRVGKDYDKFKELSNSVNDGLKKLEELEIPERAKVRIINKVNQKIKALPLEDQEYQQLEESLILILREMPGYQLPPNYALMMAMANVMLPRILDVVVDY